MSDAANPCQQLHKRALKCLVDEELKARDANPRLSASDARQKASLRCKKHFRAFTDCVKLYGNYAADEKRKRAEGARK